MDKLTKTRYNKAPTLGHSRTRFDLSHSILTTGNTGDFINILAEPVYPGETFSLNVASLTRLETSLHQTMDNAYVEIAFFFVPNRILWDNFDKFLGANDDPWTQTTQYEIPQIVLGGGSSGSVAPGSQLNHLALPVGQYGYLDNGVVKGLSIDALPLRGTFQVYNDWYRDENYDSIIYFSKGDSDVDLDTTYLFNGNNFDPSQSVLKVNRFKDAKSTALPAPQKSNPITIGLTGYAPIIGDGNNFHAVNYPNQIKFITNSGSTSARMEMLGVDFPSGGSSGGALATDVVTRPTSPANVTQTNMVADLNQATAVTINQLRLAIAAQSIAERDARGGTRLKEKIYSTWHIDCPDARLDRAEFLGGKRIPVSMMEVLQTSETGTTVLGTDAGHSKTVDSSESFVKSFLEYGWILGFAYVRTARSYSQGIDKKFFNKSKWDLYDPMLDRIGEVALSKKELYAIDTSSATKLANTEAVFGYQEAWYHLKERENRFSGYFQSHITGTLDTWHYGDDYASLPQMSASWLKETADQVDRTIAVTSEAELAFQWSFNFHFEMYATRMMGKYSIPNTFGF